MPINSIISRLKQSLMFNLSLSAKELFHSNFLVYLMEQHPNIINDVLSINGFNFVLTSNHEVLRESSHTDIMVRNGKGIELIIENKFKSIPYIEQLEKYTKVKGVDTNTKFILLTLYIPASLQCNNGQIIANFKNWDVLTYKDFITGLKASAAKYLPSGSFERTAIEDYCIFMDDLMCYINHFSQPNPFNIKSLPISPAEKQLRMHDITSKIRYNIVAESVFSKIKGQNLNVGFDEAKLKAKKSPYIFIDARYEQAGPLLECQVRIDLQNNEYVLYIIQVQNCTYGRGLLFFDNNGNNLPSHACAWQKAIGCVKLKSLLKDRLVLVSSLKSNWKSQWQGSVIWGEEPIKPAGKAQNNPYFHFGSFILEKWDISQSNKTVNDLVDQIVDDIAVVYNRLP